MHLYNLYLAIIWLVLAAWLLLYRYLLNGTGASFALGDTDVSLGWVALVLAGYNLIRWWFRRQAIVARRREEFLARTREHADRDRKFRESGRVPDPNFIFDERDRKA